jgi:hypothetical protein
MHKRRMNTFKTLVKGFNSPSTLLPYFQIS